MYESDTAFHPDQDYELPNEPSLLESKSISHLDRSRSSPRAYVALIVDGDSLLFTRKLLEDGFHGGQRAAERVTARIRSYLEAQHFAWRAEIALLDVHAYVICNQTDLSLRLSERTAATHETLRHFRAGWMLKGPFYEIQDAGRGKQAADLRVRARLVDAVLDRDCKHVFFGGLDDFGYANELVGLRRIGLLDKVTLLDASDWLQRSKRFDEYSKRLAIWRDVFTPTSKFSWSQLPAPAADASASTEGAATKKITAKKGGVAISIAAGDRPSSSISEPEPVRPMHRKGAYREGIAVDRKRPCVDYHLLGACAHGPECRLNHEPLSAAELHEFRKITRRTPCPALAVGEVCEWGAELCPYGH